MAEAPRFVSTPEKVGEDVAGRYNRWSQRRAVYRVGKGRDV